MRKLVEKTIKKMYQAEEDSIFIFGIYDKEMTFDEVVQMYINDWNSNKYECDSIVSIIESDDELGIKLDREEY